MRLAVPLLFATSLSTLAQVTPTATLPAPTASLPLAATSPTAPTPESGQQHELTWKNVPVRDIVALINLAVVLVIFLQNRTDRRRERQSDLRERKAKLRLEIGLFWVQKIVIEPNEQFMFEFFVKYTQKLDDLPATLPVGEGANVADLTATARAEISAFKDDLRIFRRKIEEPLVWISPLFRTVSETLRAVEDLVTQHLHVIPGVIVDQPLNQKPSDELQKLRRELFERLYSAQKEFSQLDEV